MRRLIVGTALTLALLAVPAVVGLTAPEPPWNLPTNCSGTIASSGVPQQIIAATGVHHGFQLQNLTSTQMSWSDLTSTPSIGGAGSWSLAVSSTPYQTSPTFASGGAVFIVGTTNSTFACEVW